MKSVIIYASLHHKNTEKIARAVAAVLGAEAISFTEANKERVMAADLIGFGSGIYYGKFHKELANFIKDLPEANNKKVFIFSTAGVKQNHFFNRGHEAIRKSLQDKNFQIVGEFECLGHDTNSFLKYIGGINKGRPNKEDVKRAEAFAKGLC